MDFTTAKARLSELMRDLLLAHRPFTVFRRGDAEEMVALPSHDLVAWGLRSYRFDAQVTFGEGQVVATIPKMGVVGAGATFEEAMADLASNLLSYAKVYFSRRRFYEETDRADHYPWLLRFVLTPPPERVNLLIEDSRELHPVQDTG